MPKGGKVHTLANKFNRHALAVRALQRMLDHVFHRRGRRAAVRTDGHGGQERRAVLTDGASRMESPQDDKRAGALKRQRVECRRKSVDGLSVDERFTERRDRAGFRRAFRALGDRERPFENFLERCVNVKGERSRDPRLQICGKEVTEHVQHFVVPAEEKPALRETVEKCGRTSDDAASMRGELRVQMALETSLRPAALVMPRGRVAREFFQGFNIPEEDREEAGVVTIGGDDGIPFILVEEKKERGDGGMEINLHRGTDRPGERVSNERELRSRGWYAGLQSSRIAA